ncbi:MAG: hypothetical protein HYW57_03090 [Ignavibacteriales bacterium]|nr:hypothetical protein [Ignavibacteriales bacterium]
MKLTAWCFALFLLAALSAAAQERNYNPVPMAVDVGNFQMSMNKLMGEGGLQTQFSWMLTGANPSQTEIFYWPRDQWQSNMLYQIFNPVVLDDNGIIDEFGQPHALYTRGDALTNAGVTDWAIETRRYRPPSIIVDGIELTPPYRWEVDPSLVSDIKLEFEDVCPQFGIRSHVEVFAFSNPSHGDYFIWKATQKFTGEIRRPRDLTAGVDSLPDQTIRIWWPISFSFGPSKAGERHVNGAFGFEGEDDLDSWFVRKSDLVTGSARESLYVAYYWDDDNPNAQTYQTVGSSDDAGDPDRTTGFLHSPQIPGFALLHADMSASDPSDDPAQPYAMPHATIVADFWGRRDVGLRLTYRGDDGRGRFPLDAITAGLATAPQKGPMRFITMGPYDLTKNAALGRYDSISFAVAVGVGSIGYETADSLGRAWFNNEITDAQKRDFIAMGRDSLWKVMDRANWSWDRIKKGLPIPSPPPPPDVEVTSGPDRITVSWSYPDGSHFSDPTTGVDDWSAWRVYRKRGAYYVNDPLDQQSGERWELVFETQSRNVTSYVDASVQRGVDYYYAVTAVDDGTQNTFGVSPGEALESSRYVNRSQLPTASFKPGLNVSGLVRVVPNPATVAAGALGFAGTPDKILFVNLPVECRLRIFTETGDLVKTIDHYGTADHEWDQRTDQNQYVSSGIYILTVTEAKNINGKPLDNQFVKFVLVR